jgi:hypothetical protein
LVGPHDRLSSLSSFPDVLVDDPRPVPPQSLRFLHTSRDLPPLLADVRDASETPDDEGRASAVRCAGQLVK